MSITEPSRPGMTPSILEPTDLVELLLEEPPSPHLADLLWASGDSSAARLLYESMWQQADPDALVTLVTLDQVSSIPNRDAPLHQRAREILEAAGRQAITAAQAQQLLLFLSRLAAFRLRDYDESTRLSILAAGHFDIAPLLFAGLRSAGIKEYVWRPCLQALVSRAEATKGIPERIERLLLAVMLGAEFKKMDLLWYERLARCAKAGTGSISLYFLLSLLDLCGLITSEAAAADARNYLHLLAEAITDEHERFSYTVRFLEFLAFSGSVDEALAELKLLSESKGSSLRPLLLQKCQLIAFSFGRFGLGAEIAEARGEETPDLNLKRALFLQAEELFRNGRVEPERLSRIAGKLAEHTPDTQPEEKGVLDHARSVLVSLALQTDQDDQLLEIWQQQPDLESTDDRALSRVLYRREEEELVPQAQQLARLVQRDYLDVPSIALRAALSLLLVGDGWETLAGPFNPEQVPTPLQESCLRLKAYCQLYRQDQPAEALAILERLFESYDYSPKTLWALWEAARRLDRLESYVEVFSRHASQSAAGTQQAMFIALQGATLAACGQVEEGHDLIVSLSQTMTPSRSMELVDSRLLDLIHGATPIQLVSSEQTVRKAIEPAMVELVEQGEQQMAAGDIAQAGRLFSEAAQVVLDSNPAMALPLLVRAGTALLEAEVELAEAERCFSSAFELDREEGTAWRGMCSVRARAGRFLEVAELVAARPSFLETEVVPVADLLLAARALTPDHPDQARVIYSFLLELGSVDPTMAENPEELGIFRQISEQTGQIDLYRDLLESLLPLVTNPEAQGQLHLKLGEVFATGLPDTRLALEHLQAALGDPETKEQALELLLPLSPTEARPENRMALLRSMAEATDDPETKARHLEEAAALLAGQADQVPQAIELLEQALAADSKHVPALLRVAELHQGQKEWERAVGALESAARLVSDKARRSRIYLELGNLQHEQLKRPKQAQESYLVSFLCDNTNQEAYDHLDKLYAAAGRFKDLVGVINVAIQVSEQSPEISPYNLEELYARRAHIEYRFLKEPAQAAQSLLNALTLAPSNRNYLKLLESYLAKAASPETMLKAYEVFAAALPPDSKEMPRVLRARATYCEQIPERRQEAVELLSRLLQLEPVDLDAFSKLEEHYQSEGLWHDLIRLYHQRLDWVSEPEEMVRLHQRIAAIHETELADLNAAAQTYSELLEAIPESLKALRGLGRLYEGMRRWDDLIEVTRREIDLVEDARVKAHLLFRLGSIYETHREQEDLAIEHYQRAVECDPGCVPALHGLRDIFQRREDAARVIEYLEMEVGVWESPREQASIHTRIGEVYSRELQEPLQAIEHYKSALELVPEHRPALEGLLDIYFENQDWPEASPIAYSLSQHPEALRNEARSDLFRRRGIIALHLGNRREALSSFEIALQLDPTNRTALQELFSLLDEEMDAEEHGEFFTRLQKELAERQEDEGLARVRQFLGSHAERTGNLDEAVMHYSSVLDLVPQEIEGLNHLVHVLIRARRFEEALDRVHRFAEETTSPESWIEANLVAGQLLLDHLGQRQRARDLFNRILEKSHHHRQALFLSAQAAYLDSDWENARRAMETLVQLDEQDPTFTDLPGQAEHLFYQARILQQGFSDHTAALELHAKALQLNPVDPRPLKAQALILLETDQQDRLEELFEQAIAAAARAAGESATVEPLLLAVRVYHHREMPEQAERHLKRLLDLEPSHQAARALLVEVAHLLQAKGETSTAEPQKLLESNVLDATALFGLASLSLKRGRIDAASRFWRVLELIGDPRADQPPEDIASVVDSPLRIDAQDEQLARWLHPELMMGGYLAALKLMGPFLGKLGLVGQPSPPSRSQQLQPEEQQAMDALLAEVTASLPSRVGTIRCYQEGPRGTAINIQIADQPTILLEMDCSLDSAFQKSVATFLIAASAELLHRGGYTPIAIPRADLTRVLWWLSCWREVKSPAPPREEAFWLEDMDPKMTSAMHALVTDPQALFVPLEDPQDAQRLAIELEQAAMLDADRVGLVVANQLKAAVEGVLKLETGFALADLPDVIDELTRSERLVSLVRFAVSEEYFQVRQRLLPT
ncbi:MAG: hypothetical protein JW797_07605 [Bradymonadales bacterium]|nr:hypothetical protein [Bradymonadales bacterium]